MKSLFIRSEKSTIDNALNNPLDLFIKIYQGITSEKILSKAYYDIRKEKPSTTIQIFGNKPDLLPIISKEVKNEITKIKPSKEVKVKTKVDAKVIKEKALKAPKVKVKPALRKYFDEGVSYEEAIKLIFENHSLEVDKYYAKYAYQEFEKIKETVS